MFCNRRPRRKVRNNIFFLVYVFTKGRRDITPKIWSETYLSGVLRSILYSDEEHFRFRGYIKINPIPDIKAEERFFNAVEDLFFEGNTFVYLLLLIFKAIYWDQTPRFK